MGGEREGTDVTGKGEEGRGCRRMEGERRLKNGRGIRGKMIIRFQLSGRMIWSLWSSIFLVMEEGGLKLSAV